METIVAKHIHSIFWNKKDVTRDLSSKIIRVDYRDMLEHRASTLELAFEDKEALFMGEWYPQVDDTLQAYIGLNNANLLDTGIFFIDEITNEYNRFNQCTATVRALSATGKSIYSEKKFKQYISVPFKDVANEVASELGYKVSGDTSGKVSDNRTTTGLEFLSKQATKLGKVMKVENNTIYFYRYVELFEKSTIEINRNEIFNCTITDKAEGRYRSCTCKWYDSKTKTLYSGQYVGGGSGADVTIWVEVKSNEEAIKSAESYITEKNKYEKYIELKYMGDVRMLAGVAVVLKGFGKHDGKYIVDQSQHLIMRSGYTNTIYLKK